MVGSYARALPSFDIYGAHPRAMRHGTQVATICSALWRGRGDFGAAQSPRQEGQGPQEIHRQTFGRRLGKKQAPRQQRSVGAPLRIEISACVRRHWWQPPPDECKRSPTGNACMRSRLRCIRSSRAAAPQHTETKVLKPVPLLLCREMFHLHSVYPAALLKLICGRRPGGGREVQSLTGCLGIASSSGVLK